MSDGESAFERSSLQRWLSTPAGQLTLGWEQQQLDAAVADRFGFHALQLGVPELDALRANRMPHRWVAAEEDAFEPAQAPVDEPPEAPAPPAQRTAVALHCDFDALPFPNHSLDLIVLPHTLELARDPHLTLAEVERVLMPEGRVVIVGFNPASLWGLRQRAGRMREHLGGARPLFLPRTGEFIGYWRLRDWLRLLSFEVEGGRFGCYRPAFASQRWLERFGWIEPIGERWWPVLGAVYFLVAVKRVRGMRLVGLARRAGRMQPKAAPAVSAQTQGTAHVERQRPVEADPSLAALSE